MPVSGINFCFAVDGPGRGLFRVCGFSRRRRRRLHFSLSSQGLGFGCSEKLVVDPSLGIRHEPVGAASGSEEVNNLALLELDLFCCCSSVLI
jgi:hypothetical protein